MKPLSQVIDEIGVIKLFLFNLFDKMRDKKKEKKRFCFFVFLISEKIIIIYFFSINEKDEWTDTDRNLVAWGCYQVAVRFFF